MQLSCLDIVINRTKYNLKINYSEDICRNAIGNMNATWKAINTILLLAKNREKKSIDELKINGCLVSDKNEIATSINDFFVNISKDLAKRLQSYPDDDINK